MKLFIKRVLIFLAIPLPLIALLLIGYVYLDPFKVIHLYRDYSYSRVIPNRDYVSTEMFNKNREKYKYNSFIFGSSRTLAYRPDSWIKYLDKDARPFVFDASGESIYGIYTKLKYLDSIHAEIRNALIIICRDVSFSAYKNHRGHLGIKHPATSGESKLAFQSEFLKAYFDPHFMLSYYTFTITKEYKPFMAGFIADYNIALDTVTNRVILVDQEVELAENPAAYYAKREKIFYTRNGESQDPVQEINDRQLFMLGEVERILKKNNTHYKVVISPLYEQKKFSNQDLAILRNTFGDHLYDFSGENKFTDEKTNYYEISHYRTFIGDSILEAIYK